MFRRHKKLAALFSALVLAAMQLHSVLHLLGHEKGHHAPEPCAVCEVSLHQNAVHTPAAAPGPAPAPGFAALQVSIPCLTPQFRGFSPSLRAPPAVS